MRKFIKISNALTLVIAFFLLFYTAGTYVFAKNLKVPNSPSDLTVSEVTESSVTLIWNNPESSSNILKYRIYNNSTFIDSTKATTYTINDLKPETEYNLYIRSESERNNISMASERVTVKTLPISGTINSGNKIIGYYPSWKSYSGFTPDKLDASKLTHINYAFAYIGQDNKIKLGYPDKDPENFKKINELKSINPDLKILISVGGWNWSGNFSDTASTEISRITFAKSCVEFITEYRIDGIDLDWEYPVGGGLSTNSKRPQDKQNFTLLLKEIHKKLDEQGKKDNKKYLLTIAGGASNYYLNNIESNKIKEYIDFVNIMTYDLHGPWDLYSDFNAPLFNSSDTSPQYKISVESSVNAWINAGFTKDKLVVGVPFYGYLYKLNSNANNGVYQKFTDGKALSYTSIKTNYMNYDYSKFFDSESKVPWLYKNNTFISYDDAESLALKAEYIKNEKLGGVMIWELSQDYNNELLNSIFEVLR